MKATAVAIAVLACLAGTACRSSEASGLADRCEPLNQSEAEQVVRQWVYEDYNPDMNPSAEFPLEETTTDRIWNRLDSQLYTCTSTTPGMSNRPLLIECEDVFDLGQYRGLGGHEVDELRVTDLDADGSHELVFLDTWGSGIVRTAVVMYLDDGDKQLLQADVAFTMNVDFERVSDQELYIVDHTQEGVDEPRIGRVLLESGSLVETLTIELVDGLPADVLDDIWFDYGT